MVLRHLLTLLSGVSLVLCAAAVLLHQLPRGVIVLRGGGGGFGGGSDIATYALFAHGIWIGIGWTHSDVWYEGTMRLPVPLLAVVAALPPLRWAARVTWPWSYKSLPELAGLPDAEGRRVWGRCVDRVSHRPSAGMWVAIALMFVLVLSLPLLSADSGVRITVPIQVYWGSAAAIGLLFGRAMVAAARRHIPAELPGHCRGCGYDLTGNASGVCPECGRAAAV